MTFKLLFTFLCATTVANCAVLRVDVEDLRNNQRVVYCELFHTADGFPTKPEKAHARVKAEIKHGAAICEFSNVSPGTYAVAAFHDEKGTGKLQRNFLGVPKQGVGLLDSLSTMDEGSRVANDQVLMTVVSACVLQERFRLAA